LPRAFRFGRIEPFSPKNSRGFLVFSLYAALAVGFVLTAVLFTVAIPFLVGLFDRHDLF